MARQRFSELTILSASAAMTSSSFVGMTQTGTRESSAEIFTFSDWSFVRSFISGSSFIPR